MNEEVNTKLNMIGRVIRTDPDAAIEVLPQYRDGLRGLADFSHVFLIYWLHQSDTPTSRQTLLVHPRGKSEIPLTGVFATRSPVRPNPIGLSVTSLRSIEGNVVSVGHLDAFEGTPILDIKPYLPSGDSIPMARVANWI
jgi:tRNA-Thr(GGU) m(6)t(6)A37 methyltransferase TsaA